MAYFRVQERLDAIGRKVLQYTDPENPQLIFMPYRPDQNKRQKTKIQKKKSVAKVFLFKSGTRVEIG